MYAAAAHIRTNNDTSQGTALSGRTEVCVCARMCVCLCVCLCVCEREGLHRSVHVSQQLSQYVSPCSLTYADPAIFARVGNILSREQGGREKKRPLPPGALSFSLFLSLSLSLSLSLALSRAVTSPLDT